MTRIGPLPRGRRRIVRSAPSGEMTRIDDSDRSMRLNERWLGSITTRIDDSDRDGLRGDASDRARPGRGRSPRPTTPAREK